jgi:hypothetical protein
MHFVISRLVKSSCAAVLINNLLWVLFFTIKAPYETFNLIERKNLAIYLFIMTLITITIITLIIRYKNKYQNHIIFKILSVFWLVIFMFNAVPSFVYVIGNNSKYIANENNYKTKFYVDNNLPSPNIYWLLMDGMLGFKAMEYLFNDPQTEFTAQLIERGFIINRDAQFEAIHATAYSIPVLMCPHYYDSSFISELWNINIDEYKQKIKLTNKPSFSFVKSINLARIRNELITAFNNRKKYQTSVITLGLTYLPPITNKYYLGGKKIIKSELETMNDIESIQFGLSLLFITTPLTKLHSIISLLLKIYQNNKFESTVIQKVSNSSIDIFKSFYGESYRGNDKWYIDALADIMIYSGPKLTIIHDGKAHSPFIYDEHGNKITRRQKEALDPYNYPSQHHFTSAIVISYIDFILNIDPFAIIIIQADHGLHDPKTRDLFISKYGKTDEDVKLMQNQTINAVRIPEKWGGLEQPIEPPNITRLLVNRYVGENYKFLASEDIIK